MSVVDALRALAPPCFVLLCTACQGPTTHDDPNARQRRATFGDLQAEVDERFVSFAVDSAQLIGGTFWNPDGSVTGATGTHPVSPYDFSQPKLRKLMAALGPSILRLGGSDADDIYYAVTQAPEPLPEGYRHVLTPDIWQGVADFAEDLGWGLFFTLNAGPGPRDADRVWTSDNARAWVEFTTQRGDPVEVWELGNEINAYQALHGADFRIDGASYAADLRTAKDMLLEVGASGRLAGPSSAFWPEVGEAFAVYPDVMAAQDGALDLVTWHYYPQQSVRCPLASRRAAPELMRDPDALDEIAVWAAQVEAERDAHAPGIEVWLGETGNAQCGGEPGLSDRFIASFWWLDQLGQLAARGQPVVVRQNISGADYAILDEPLLDPRPDYWASLLFKRYMGTRVLGVERGADRSVRSYAHCTPKAQGQPAGAITIMLINLSESQGVFLDVKGVQGRDIQAFRVQSDDAEGRTVALNGQRLAAANDGTVPDLAGLSETLSDEAPQLYLPASAYGFFVIEDAAHPDCL